MSEILEIIVITISVMFILTCMGIIVWLFCSSCEPCMRVRNDDLLRMRIQVAKKLNIPPDEVDMRQLRSIVKMRVRNNFGLELGTLVLHYKEKCKV